MAPIPQYGSISHNGGGDDDEPEASLELLPHGHSAATTTYANPAEKNDSGKQQWTRHHCISYSITALICIVSARYWHGRAASYDANPSKSDNDIGVKRGDVYDRVPMPPALSNLDPAADLGFRSTTRTGVAAPSKAWGEHFLGSTSRKLEESESASSFTPLPTNQWYLNLVSHRAAEDPSKLGEVGHVYTIPYVLGVSPPHPQPVPGSDTKNSKYAGIELFVPVLKTSDTNMQMVFDAQNGVAIGAMVEDKKSTKDALTSYEVDPDESISPLGVSLRWKHVNMRTHIVRGMPYGTVRFGKDDNKKPVLPSIMAGNMPRSILLDSDSESNDSTSKKNKMLCGSLTGKPIEQGWNHHAPISSSGKAEAYEVKREIIFTQDLSDFTWVVFFSKPVSVKCYSDAFPSVSVPMAKKEVQFRLDVTEILDDGEDDNEELVVRVALLSECTTGKGIIKDHCDHLDSLGYETISSSEKSDQYLEALRKSAHLYPKSPLVGTQFPDDEEERENADEDGGRVTNIVFDWDATSCAVSGNADAGETVVYVEASSLRATTSKTLIDAASTAEDRKSGMQDEDALIMFALPHHIQSLSATDSEMAEKATDSPLCIHSFHGRTCLVHGSKWNLPVAHGEPQSFLADRPPIATAIPALSEALNSDIKFKLSSNLRRGAADTYFSAKIYAKVGRLIEIREELQSLKSGQNIKYSDADDSAIKASASSAAEVTIPSESEVESLLDDLQQSVEVWLIPGGKAKKGAEAEFIYDASWGGFVNCGCNFTFVKGHEADGTCSNVFPKCPALDDVNIDFGNGWYNDHHFHYGYNVYAAAVVAKHRPDWGREYFDRVLLYIRDIANPSAHDQYFPMYRQKDWYLGNSWASGLMSMELSPHGREQESSSEAIAAFEGIALYGGVMMDAFAEDDENLETARLVRNLGEFLTTMEVEATTRFWHIWGSKYDEGGNLTVSSSQANATSSSHVNTYAGLYKKPVVGMMYDTMASFQTWFAPEEVVSYGIQLMPLTSIAERRDDPEWLKLVYPVYADSCEAANEANDGFCEDNGWSIIQTGLLAETGEIDEALNMVSKIPDDVYKSDGGCGNSLSNSIWFISTRKISSSGMEHSE